MVNVGEKIEDMRFDVFVNNNFKKMSFSDYEGKWTVLFFYPKDFTFVCPTELSELADIYEELQKMNVEVISVSTDTVEVHKAWFDVSPKIAKIKYPMAADPTHKICRAYNVLIEEEGIALRGTFVIDPKGIIRTMEVHEDGIGRSAKELKRKIQAAQFVDAHGEVCPASWEPGEKTLKPGVDLVGKI
jgi:NADH-dependent peroxiredoxin subunit C